MTTVPPSSPPPPAGGDALARILAAATARGVLLRTVRVKITAAAGTVLTVQLPDGASVPGQGVLGLTYTVNAYGVAFVQEKALPLVFPV
jgi:hypothetical protein